MNLNRKDTIMRGPLLLILLALATHGCATLPVDPSKMTPEQITAAVKDKSASVGCATVQTPYKGNTVFLNLDRGVLNVGEITVDSECKVTIKNDKPAPAPRATP